MPHAQTVYHAMGLSDEWWAGGLALAERSPACVDEAPETGGRRSLAQERLTRWRASHGLGATGQFRRLLDDIGIEEDAMLGLLAEPRDALAARVVKPAWADLIERAISDAPVETVRPSPMDPWPDTFAIPLRPLVVAASERLARQASEVTTRASVDLASVIEGFVKQLSRRLAALAARTMVLTLSTWRTAGRLTGADPRERFADFVAQLAGGRELASLFAQHPVLARLLGQAAHFAVDAQLELLTRYASDRREVIDTLLQGEDPGPLVAVDAGAGDLHHRGRSVTVLGFGAGARVVYKPRPLDPHVSFTGLMTWLNQALPGLHLRAVAAVARPGYGWLEHVPTRPCGGPAAVERFYRRLGALLALLHAVDARDIHFENLIACGDQPVLIDLETILHPTLPRPAVVADPAASALAASVASTALLPQLWQGEHGVLDVSALGGDRAVTFPADTVGWEAPGTDQMRLVRRAAQFHGAVNRPRLGGNDQDPAQYRGALLEGFRASYDAISDGRREVVALLTRCADDEMRIVMRPTMLYSRLLDESTHPEVLQDGLERDRTLDLLWALSVDDPARERLVGHEIVDLWAGDVPCFSGRADSTDVWTTTGKRVPDVLADPPLTAALQKIDMMSPTDRRNQEWIVNATLATRSSPHHGDAPPLADLPVAAGSCAAGLDPEQLSKLACDIADEIMARAVSDNDRVNWLGLEVVDDARWAVLPMGAGLAEGYTGVALFLAQLSEITGTARHADMARRAVQPIRRLVDALSVRPDLVEAIGCGGFYGLGGVCYGLARLATLLDDAELRSWLSVAVELAGAAASAPDSHGVAAGSAGCLAAMNAVQAEQGLAAAAQLARVCADRLLEAADHRDGLFAPPVPTGFANGTAGMGWALLRFATTGAAQAGIAGAAPDTERYFPVGRALIRRDAPRDRATDGASTGGWCAGMAGSMMSVAELASPDQLAQTVEMLGERPLLRDMSLCHGELGVTEAFTVLAKNHHHENAARQKRRHAGLVIRAIHGHGPVCGTPDGVPTPGLLTGLAGIGYGVLRLGFAERVPSLLLLEPTPTRVGQPVPRPDGAVAGSEARGN